MKLILLLISALGLSVFANAQFIVAGDTAATNIFHKIINDTLYIQYPPSENDTVSEWVSLDLNDDEIDDFSFRVAGYHYSDSYGTSCFVFPLNDNEIIVNKLPFYDNQTFPDTLNLNDTIDSAKLWCPKPYYGIKLASDEWILYYGGEVEYGIWNGLPYKYVGLAVNSNSKTYYAWVQIRLNAGLYGATIYIKDCAIVKSTEGISNNPDENRFRVYPNPSTGRFVFSGERLDNTPVMVMDLAGKTVFTGIIRENKLDFENLESGLYILRISAPNGFYHLKVQILD